MSGDAPLRALAETLERVRGTSSKNQKVDLLSAYLRDLNPKEAELAARLATGRTSERGRKDETQVGYATIIEILLESSDTTEEEISEVYRKHGDLGEVAFEVLGKKRETALFEEHVTLTEMQAAFDRMGSIRGKGASSSRKAIVKSLLLRATPLEGKYIVKILTGEMRTGLVQGLVEEAIAKAFEVPKELIMKAHLLLGDVGLLAYRASARELDQIRIEPLRPLNFMLAEPMSSAAETAEHFRKVVYAEYKYDGVRAQVHKLGDTVMIFSRRLENITTSFPEVKQTALALKHDFVVDGEIVPFLKGRPLPFQLLQRRLRRIDDFEKAATAAPVTYFVFDLLYLDGSEYYARQLKERETALSRLVRGTAFMVAQRERVATSEEIAALFSKSRVLGYEGLVVKDPESEYSMGKRGNAWVKLKVELDTIDAVIVAAEYGHGKRAGVLSDYTFAVRDGRELRTIGKAYSGLTDEEIDEMTTRLKKLTLEDHGYSRSVRPELVIEVAFDSIQLSDRHDSGYALRFPRIKRIRDDKSVEQVDTLDKVMKIFNSQKVKLEET
jgi:DNA ligase-1